MRYVNGFGTYSLRLLISSQDGFATLMNKILQSLLNNASVEEDMDGTLDEVLQYTL